jgi:dsDNA-binding SOS-regulon protein
MPKESDGMMRFRIPILFLLLILMPVSSVWAAKIFFADSFVDSDGKRPPNWEFNTTDGKFWMVQNGWLESGNGEDLISSDGYSYGLINVNGTDKWTDYALSCRFWMHQPDGAVGLLGRWTDERNHYTAILEIYEGRRVLKLTKTIRGKETVLNSVVVDTEAADLPKIESGSEKTPINMSMSFIGSKITVSLAGQDFITARDVDLLTGTAGVIQRYNEISFDDVIVVSTESGSVDASAIEATYHVKLGQNLTTAQFQTLSGQLGRGGFGSYMIHPDGNGLSIYAGCFASQTEADKYAKMLSDAGIETQGVVSQKRGPVAGGAGEGVFRVKVRETNRIYEARSLMESLKQNGFPAVISSEGDVYNVYVGEFKTRREATEMHLRMVSEGYSFAEIVDTSRRATKVIESTPAAQDTNKSKSLIPEGLQGDPQWALLTPTQRDKVMETIMFERASRADSKSDKEIAELKKRVDALDSNQKVIFNKIQSAEEEKVRTEESVRKILEQMQRAENAEDYNKALELVEELKKVQPNSSIAMMKEQRYRHILSGTWEGEDQFQQKKQQEVAQLISEAKMRENNKEYSVAQRLWEGVIEKDPTDKEKVAMAQEAIARIGKQMKQQTDSENAQAAQSQRNMYMIIGGMSVFLVAAVIILFLLGRARHRQMMNTMEEMANSSLQDLSRRAQVLGSSSPIGGSSIDFRSRESSMLGQSEPSDSEFVIPETEMQAQGYGMVEETSPGFSISEELISGEQTMPSVDDYPIPQGAVPPTPSVMPQAPPQKQMPPRTPRQALPEVTPAERTSESTGDFLAAMGAAPQPRRPAVGIPAPPPMASSSSEIDLPFDNLDDLDIGLQQPIPEMAPYMEPVVDEPSTVRNAPMDTTADNEEIVFSFEEETAPAASSPPPSRPMPMPQPIPGSEEITDLVDVDTISLDGVDLGIDLTPQVGGYSQPASSDGEIQIDFEDSNARNRDEVFPSELTSPQMTFAKVEPVNVPSADALFESFDMMSGMSGPSGKELFRLGFDQDKPGVAPSGWSGSPTSYATLTVVPSPDGSGGNCLRFKKTEGAGPTSFAYTFPSVGGRVCIEFDLRCDHKNKHLLGFYIEKDGDFRRSVHTVIQCTDPEKPAHLRVFTKPTAYTLGTWRRIKYVIDLPEGTVDGYVDGEPVADNVRMATKADSLNTLKIRDNTETVGTLYINNLTISAV